jgi:hypothetical protein
MTHKNKTTKNAEFHCSKESPGDQKALEWDNMEKFGWYGHMLKKDPHSPTGSSYHTHGFEKNFKHLDIQIVLQITVELAHRIAAKIASLIKRKKIFREGVQYSGIIKKFKVCFLLTAEADRKVMRVILPTKKGILDKEKMNDVLFEKQWKEV